MLLLAQFREYLQTAVAEIERVPSMFSRLSIALVVASFATISMASEVHHMHIVSIGVDTSLEKTKDLYADDAAAMLTLFRNCKSPELYKLGVQVILRESDATPGLVLEKVAVVEKNAGDSDVTIVYFSCHGKANDSSDDLGLYLKGGILEGKQLLNALAAVRGHVVLILDTCRAGSLMPQYRPESDHKRVSILIASQANEDSSGGAPGDGILHGFFTNAIREGVLGAADDLIWGGNGDGFVSLPELAAYASWRASVMYRRQSAIVLPATLPELQLMKYTKAEKALSEVSLAHEFFRPRNDWNEPDVVENNDYRVEILSRKTKLPRVDSDPNASPWPANTISGSAPECLNGSDWAGRWKYDSDKEWTKGNVEIKVSESTMFFRFSDGDDEHGNVYLFETRFLKENDLGGRYHNVRQTTNDCGLWVGRFVDYDRIDGAFIDTTGRKGRWDFRRVYSGTPSPTR